MTRWGKFALIALVIVALLSIGADVTESQTSDRHDATTCASGTLTVSTLDPSYDRNASVTYENLSADLRSAFDRALESDGSTEIDPAILEGSPLLQDVGEAIIASSAIVLTDGARYNVIAETSDCPAIAGLPPVTNHVVYPLLAIYRLFSPLYLPVAALLAIAVAYRRVDAWLRFE